MSISTTPRIRRSLLAAIGLSLAFAPSWNATALNIVAERPPKHSFAFSIQPNTEGLLIQSLIDITQGRTDTALATIDKLISNAPNFKLAHLVRGDLLMARARQLGSFGAGIDAPTGTITDFRDEARVRLEHYLDAQAAPDATDYLWQLDDSQQDAIVVDTAKSRLYLYRNENGAPKYVADYYITVGKNGSGKEEEGDKRTPLGLYFAGSRLQRKLPDLYGSAAFPLSYPNEWDRHNGKNGHGIWLHGTPSDTYSRPPRASDGCVVLTNPDLQALAPILQTGKTPVIIARDLAPVASEQLAAEKEQLLHDIDAWRHAWESQDANNYLAFYSRDFFAPGHDFDRWAQEKRRILATRTDPTITLSNISMFRYPNDGQTMVVVNFDQDYKSNNLDDRMRKRQYWILENNRWKILYEGAA